jgi:AcrR family transcriptional regulator
MTARSLVNAMFTYSDGLIVVHHYMKKQAKLGMADVVEQKDIICSLSLDDGGDDKRMKTKEKRPLYRRIQRTLPLLQEALFQLIIERGYEPVTIADITERANLGRTTFYLHYRNKEDLLQASIKAILHDLHLEVELATEKPCTYSTVSNCIFQHIAGKQQLYQAMLREAGPTRMLEDAMRGYFIELCQRFLPQDQSQTGASHTIRNDILAVHAAGSLLGLLSWWLNQQIMLSAEEMGAMYCQLMTNGTSVFSAS